MIFLDLTTTLTQGDVPHGIARVERCLALALRARLGDELHLFRLGGERRRLCVLGQGQARDAIAAPIRGSSRRPAQAGPPRPAGAFVHGLRAAGRALERPLRRRRRTLLGRLFGGNLDVRQILERAGTIATGAARDKPALLCLGGAWELAHGFPALAPRLRIWVLIHDLLPLEIDCDPSERRAFDAYFRAALAHADGLFVASGWSEHRLRYHARRIGASCPPILRLPFGADHLLPPAPVSAPESGQSPYFLMIGALVQRKNHHFLIDVWRLAQSRGLDPGHLVIAGRSISASSRYRDGLIATITADPWLSTRISIRPDLPDNALLGYLLHARGLLQPSLSEGWGLPVREALALGIPAIAADLTALREAQAAGARTLPLEEELWLTALMQDGLQRGSPPHGAGEPPTWDECANRVLEALGARNP